LANDRIILKDMQFYGFHGVNAEEQALGQPYIVDLMVELDLSLPGHTDQLTDTVSYTHLYRSVKEVVEGKSQNLLEALAQSIATCILDHYQVTAVQVTIKKPRPPIKGSVVGFAAVQIHRTRN
jgi:7,8-dihydroneopterin aldolase/epimerase/oxygenase